MHTERMSRRNQAEGTVSVWAARARGARLVVAERRPCGRDRSDEQLEPRNDGLGVVVILPTAGVRHAVRCSTNSTAGVPHDVPRTSDIEFKRQTGNAEFAMTLATRAAIYTRDRVECMSDEGRDLAGLPNVKADQHTLGVR